MRVGLLATGGTISSRRDAAGDLVPVDGAADLLRGVPTPSGVTVIPVDLPPTPSFALTLDDMVGIVLRVRSLLADGSDAVVVTHGTDSLEELAFLAALLLPRDAPVVITGSQRPADDPRTDATRNVADALTVAAAGLDLCVVMGGRAIAGTEARKVHTSDEVAFSGGAAGALALVEAGEIVRLGRASRGGTFAGAVPGPLPRVDLVTVGAGTDGTHLDASVSAGAEGIVLEAFGRGNAAPDLVTSVEDAVTAGAHVVVTSRVAHGLVRPVYGAGGGADLARAGAVHVGDLTASRARVALALTIDQVAVGDVPRRLESIWRGERA